MIAVVTGASRGIGQAVVDGLVKSGRFSVIVWTARGAQTTEEDSSAAAAAAKNNQGCAIVRRSVDHSDLKAVQEFAAWVLSSYERVDVLVNNAGVFLDSGKGIGEVSVDVMDTTMKVNAYSAWILMQAFLPGMAKNGWGSVVNVSSGMGHEKSMWSEGRGGSVAYRASKSALNAFTLTAHHEYHPRYPNVFINAVCPGFGKWWLGGYGVVPC